MSELPDWIEQKLEDNIQRDLMQRPVVEAIWNAEEPYLSRKLIQHRVEEQVDDNFDKSTVISRLSELSELDVLMSDDVCGGTMYWIYDDRSNWPIPPDVDVEPTSDEMTVQEFFSEDAVRIGFFGVACLGISSLIMWLGAWMSSNNFTFYGFGAVDILVSGFTLIIAGWLALGAAIFVWFKSTPTFKR